MNFRFKQKGFNNFGDEVINENDELNYRVNKDDNSHDWSSETKNNIHQ